MELNVLAFPCGSEIGLELYRALSAAKGIALFGASTVSDHGEFVYKNYIPDVPHVEDHGFISALNQVIEKHSIDYVVPAHDSVVLKLAEAAKDGKLACKVLTSPYETCRVCRSKKETNAAFSGLLPQPRLYVSLGEVSRWPVFLKPLAGYGSRGVFKCADRQEAEFHLARHKDLLILEYLPGKEYTIDCFTDHNGKLLFCGGRERKRIMNGISVRTEAAENPVFKHAAEIINSKLKFRGVWFFQLKENATGELALMEIAPRLAGAMALYRNLGVNFALMSLYNAEGYDVSVLCNNFGLIFDRALESRFKAAVEYERAYVDWDDCVVNNGKMNLQMVAFLYQCVNSGTETVLLTRQAGDLQAELRKFRLEQAFTYVVQIKDGTPKSAFIRGEKAVFIDDSFAERKEVHEKTGIPVFAPDSIEALLTH